MSLSAFCSLFHFFVSGIEIAPFQVFFNGSGEQNVLLQYHRYFFSQVNDLIVFDIMSANKNFTFRSIVESR